MKPKSNFEPYLELRPEAFTVPASDMVSAAPTHSAAATLAAGSHPIEMPAFGGLTFTDTNPWARSGLNE